MRDQGEIHELSTTANTAPRANRTQMEFDMLQNKRDLPDLVHTMVRQCQNTGVLNDQPFKLRFTRTLAKSEA